jgi:hypothetical protein
LTVRVWQGGQVATPQFANAANWDPVGDPVIGDELVVYDPHNQQAGAHIRLAGVNAGQEVMTDVLVYQILFRDSANPKDFKLLGNQLILLSALGRDDFFWFSGHRSGILFGIIFAGYS